MNNILNINLHSNFFTKNVASSAPNAAPYLLELTMYPATSLSTPRPSTKADKNAPPKFT